MKKTNIIILLVFFVLKINAQRVYTIRDSITKEVIPYATIFFVHSNGGGLYSDEKGMVEIPDTIQQIKISHLSFNDKNIFCNKILNKEILLTQRKQLLKEVIIKNIKYKKKNIGFNNSKTIANSDFGGASGFLIAVYIPYNNNWKETPIITEINNKFKKNLFIKESYKSILRFDLQLPGKITGAPDGISLLNTDLTYKTTKFKSNLSIPLPLSINFPKEGVFIVMEWISDDASIKWLNPSIALTNVETTSYTWIKRKFKGEEWRNILNDPGLLRFKETIYKGKTINLCLGLTIIE
ncbi:MAG TPA: hypothetical protein PKZ43_04210 [Bacteroidales bacterium]|nr:hypothetical protein [Bacteroidales bacterium]HQH18735.1 hypothetical protein [Bacteroidales bacterium]HQI45635.1 hypothetical protein [Bacteroidales bacterium]